MSFRAKAFAFVHFLQAWSRCLKRQARVQGACAGHLQQRHAAPWFLTVIEKRKSKRKPVGQPAWIDLGPGSRIYQCFMKNMSETGARLALSREAPDQFVLQFSPDGSVGRRCQVIWRSRSGTEVGVKFTARTVKQRRVDFGILDC